MTTNDEILIRSLRALGQNTSDEWAADRELADFHATYAAVKDDPAALAQLDALFGDADYDLRGANDVSEEENAGAAAERSRQTENHWMTRTDCRSVLAVVQHPQALNRLMDVVPLIEFDHRVQLLFTTPTIGSPSCDMTKSLHDLGALVVPWEQALNMKFDLVVAASYWNVGLLDGPVIVVPHGLGLEPACNELASGETEQDPYIQALTCRNDDSTTVALAHEAELDMVEAARLPELPRAVLVGDVCFDRMLASRSHRQLYREALGVRADQRLVVVSSTWSQQSLFGTDPEFFARLMDELPADDYRVVGLLHPFVWQCHGRRQVLAWLSGAIEAGLTVMPPEEDWRAAIVAADLVIGDHGSTTQYAAGLDVPVLTCIDSRVNFGDNAPLTRLTQVATSLRLDQPLKDQVERAAVGHVPQRYDEVAGLITSHPRRSSANLRKVMYGLLNLSEPDRAVSDFPVPRPRPVPQLASATIGDHFVAAWSAEPDIRLSAAGERPGG